MFTKEDILNYIMSTPENTNRQVLQYMLDDIIGDGGGEGNIPLPEYECNFIDWTESGDLITDLDINNIIEDFIFVTIHFEGEEESSNFYLIYNKNTGTGIIFNERGISYMINNFYSEAGTDNIVFEVVEWPPEPPEPEPELYLAWKETSGTLNYSSYEYPNPEGGAYLSGYITAATRPTNMGKKEFLSCVQVEPIDNDNSNIYTNVVGIVIDDTFITLNNFYQNWNNGGNITNQSYQYVFTFKDTPISNSGQCKVSWYGVTIDTPK